MENYENDYRSNHSIFLNEHFDIANRWIDTYNDNNVSFEFKECFSNEVRKQRFELKKYQVELTDYFIFNLNHQEFHVIDSQFLLDTYEFPKGRSRIRIGRLREISIFQTNDIEELKEYVKNLSLL